MEQYCENLPKIELHAHLNGSLSEATLAKLAELKGIPPPTFDLAKLTIDEVWNAFAIIQQLTDSPESVEMACYLTLGEFADDNVKYIELRSTPRTEWYMASVLRGMKRRSDEQVFLMQLKVIKEQGH